MYSTYPRPAGGAELNNNTGHHREYIPTDSQAGGEHTRHCPLISSVSGRGRRQWRPASTVSDAMDWSFYHNPCVAYQPLLSLLSTHAAAELTRSQATVFSPSRSPSLGPWQQCKSFGCALSRQRWCRGVRRLGGCLLGCGCAWDCQ
jgi:hypothetical protein